MKRPCWRNQPWAFCPDFKASDSFGWPCLISQHFSRYQTNQHLIVLFHWWGVGLCCHLGEHSGGKWKEPRAAPVRTCLQPLSLRPSISSPDIASLKTFHQNLHPESSNPNFPHTRNALAGLCCLLFIKHSEYDSRIDKHRATAFDLRTLFLWMDSGEYLLFAFGPSSSCTVVSRPLLFRSQLSPGPSPSRPWQILISLLGAAVGAATQTLEMAHTVALVLASVAALVDDDPNIDPSRESATSFSGPALTCKFGSSCKFSHDNAHSPTDQSSGTRPKSQRHTGDGKLLEWKRILRQAKHTTLSSHGAAAGRFFQLGLELMDATSVLPKKPSGF